MRARQRYGRCRSPAGHSGAPGQPSVGAADGETVMAAAKSHSLGLAERDRLSLDRVPADRYDPRLGSHFPDGVMIVRARGDHNSAG
jgi:hypothetical protein